MKKPGSGFLVSVAAGRFSARFFQLAADADILPNAECQRCPAENGHLDQHKVRCFHQALLGVQPEIGSGVSIAIASSRTVAT
ncbi:MAG: hypothetical protein ACRC1J_08780, partial [Sandaracinobacteroides sp.]